jgi:glycosyltransferase involved in cell wall biosynthesis
MKILHLISSGGFYGAESMLILLSRHLEMEGCKVIVGVFSDPRNPPPEVAERAREHGLHTELIPCGGRFRWGAVRQIRGIMADNSMDVLHAHGYKTNLYARLAARKCRAALVSTAHTWQSQHQLIMRLYATLDRLVLRQFDRVATVSDVLALDLKSAGVDPVRVTTIPNGVETWQRSDVVPVFPDWSDGPIVGMIARLAPEKGGDVLLRAAPAVLAGFPDARFVLVGDGPCRPAWESLARQLGISERAIFTGTRSDVRNIYARLDVVVLPSFNEGLPMCLLEAMSAGRPVIATPVGAVVKLVIPGETGLLVPTGDADELAKAIQRLLGDREEARRLGENARAHVEAGFTAGIMTRRYLNLYYEAISSAAQGVQRAEQFQKKSA